MSTSQNTLFDDAQAPIPESVKSDLIAQASSVATSPLQKEFARLLKKIETTGQQLQTMDQLFATYRGKFANTLLPLEQQKTALEKQMVVFLHERLQQQGKSKALTPKQQQSIARMIVGISEELAMQGDEQMQTIHDFYSQESVDDKEQGSIDELRDMLDFMGVPVNDLDEDADVDQLISRLQETAQNAKEADEKLEQKRAEKAQARKAAKAKNDPKLQAKLAAQQETEQDAQSALRTIYRQLARQLHPDRADNDAQRETNHDLMSQVNAAYEKQDLLALLKLQLRAQQIDANSLTAVAEDKLRSWNKLLKDQAKQLDADLDQIQSSIAMHFHLSPFMPINEMTLEGVLKRETIHLEADLKYMETDLKAIQDDVGLKKWVKEQLKASSAQQMPDDIEQILMQAAMDKMMRTAPAPARKKKR